MLHTSFLISAITRERLDRSRRDKNETIRDVETHRLVCPGALWDAPYENRKEGGVRAPCRRPRRRVSRPDRRTQSGPGGSRRSRKDRGSLSIESRRDRSRRSGPAGPSRTAALFRTQLPNAWADPSRSKRATKRKDGPSRRTGPRPDKDRTEPRQARYRDTTGPQAGEEPLRRPPVGVRRLFGTSPRPSRDRWARFRAISKNPLFGW